jgi:hypothetical protein
LKTAEGFFGVVSNYSARIAYLYGSLEGEYLFLLVAVSRYDNGIRLLQNLLPRPIGEGSGLFKTKKEAGRRKKEKGRKKRGVRDA